APTPAAPAKSCRSAARFGNLASTMTGPQKPRPGKRTVIASLGQPKVAVMLALGFSSGLPFLLTGNTLGYWLRDEGTTLKAIGFLSWVGRAYAMKVVVGARVCRA